MRFFTDEARFHGMNRELGSSLMITHNIAVFVSSVQIFSH